MNDNGSRCKISVDGTDYRTNEPWPFNSCWFTPKHNGPGLRYEVGVCIQTGWIVWLNGPYPCGEWPDVKTALEQLVYVFEGDERAVADKGHRGHTMYFDCPWKHLDTAHQKNRKALARARHECVNRRLKQWRALKECYRHDLSKHGSILFAIANIEQLLIQQEPMWQVVYYDRLHNGFNI